VAHNDTRVHSRDAAHSSTHLTSGLILLTVLGLVPYKSGSCGRFGSLGAFGGYSFGCRTVSDARPLTCSASRQSANLQCRLQGQWFQRLNAGVQLQQLQLAWQGRAVAHLSAIDVLFGDRHAGWPSVQVCIGFGVCVAEPGLRDDWKPLVSFQHPVCILQALLHGCCRAVHTLRRVCQI
jgi:hypothetical protein